jgi:hypothetical protein
MRKGAGGNRTCWYERWWICGFCHHSVILLIILTNTYSYLLFKAHVYKTEALRNKMLSDVQPYVQLLPQCTRLVKIFWSGKRNVTWNSTYTFIKVKIKLSLFLTKLHAMKTYWGSGGIALRILDLATRWRWMVSFTPRPLYPRERAPGTHWIRGWVGLRAGLNAMVCRKIPSPCPDSNPQSSSP